MAQSERGYVQAALAVGNSRWTIAIKHVLPNSLVPSLVQMSVTIGFAIILTAGLSFVGAGVRPPTPEWGSMISIGAQQLILGEWWPSVFPGAAISLTVLGYAFRRPHHRSRVPRNMSAEALHADSGGDDILSVRGLTVAVRRERGHRTCRGDRLCLTIGAGEFVGVMGSPAAASRRRRLA